MLISLSLENPISIKFFHTYKKAGIKGIHTKISMENRPY